jgi:hypothetical protein
MIKHWRSVPANEWADLLDNIDPDWSVHFMDAEQGLIFYETHNDKRSDSENVVANAVREYTA